MGLKSAKNDALLPRGNRARKAFINSIMSQIPGSVFPQKRGAEGEANFGLLPRGNRPTKRVSKMPEIRVGASR
jgi:hypothetical protein